MGYYERRRTPSFDRSRDMRKYFNYVVVRWCTRTHFSMSLSRSTHVFRHTVVRFLGASIPIQNAFDGIIAWSWNGHLGYVRIERENETGRRGGLHFGLKCVFTDGWSRTRYTFCRHGFLKLVRHRRVGVVFPDHPSLWCGRPRRNGSRN